VLGKGGSYYCVVGPVRVSPFLGSEAYPVSDECKKQITAGNTRA